MHKSWKCDISCDFYIVAMEHYFDAHCIFPKFDYPKLIFVKFTQLACLLSFASLFMLYSVEMLSVNAIDWSVLFPIVFYNLTENATTFSAQAVGMMTLEPHLSNMHLPDTKYASSEKREIRVLQKEICYMLLKNVPLLDKNNCILLVRNIHLSQKSTPCY